MSQQTVSLYPEIFGVEYEVNIDLEYTPGTKPTYYGNYPDPGDGPEIEVNDINFGEVGEKAAVMPKWFMDALSEWVNKNDRLYEVAERDHESFRRYR